MVAGVIDAVGVDEEVAGLGFVEIVVDIDAGDGGVVGLGDDEVPRDALAMVTPLTSKLVMELRFTLLLLETTVARPSRMPLPVMATLLSVLPLSSMFTGMAF